MGKSKYIATRDIPLAVRELQTVSATRIREWIRENRTEKDARGKRRQKDITPEAITMWFSRHPEIREKLKAEIVEEELPKEVINESLFENGVFEEIPSVKQWIRDMTLRGAKRRTIQAFVNYIKRCCLGQITKDKAREWEYVEDWGIKHPDNLTIEHAKNFVFEMKKRKMYSRNARLAFRNYFRARGIPEREVNKISGVLEGAGKYAHLYATKEKLYEVFDFLKDMNNEAYRASFFAFKTASRLGATLSAEYGNINVEEHTILVLEKATKGQPKRKMQKLIPQDLWDALDLDNIEQKRGKLFKITKKELNGLLRSAYKTVIPDLEKEIRWPFHFWRHQFAQHMLRALNWNYGLVASLGGWTMDVLRKYYGMPPKEIIRKAGLETLPNI